MANNELILAPEVDRAALRRAEKNMEDAFDRVAARGGAEAMSQFSHGVEDGINKGGKRGLNHLKLAAASIAAVAAAVAIDSIEKTLGGADDVMMRMQEKLNAVSDTILTAEAFGIESGAMAAMEASFMAKGMDSSDLRGMLAGFTAAIEEEGGEEYKAIREEQGLESSFLTYLKSISELDKSQQVGAMIPVLGEEDSALAGRIVSVMEEMTKAGKEITTTTLTETILGTDVDISDLTSKAEEAQIQSEKMAQTNAKAFLDSFKPVSDESVKSMQDLIASNRELEKAHEQAFDLKVAAKITANELEIGQINAVKMVADAFGFGIDSKEKPAPYEWNPIETVKEVPQRLGRLIDAFTTMPTESKGIPSIPRPYGMPSHIDIEEKSEQRANSAIQNASVLTGEKK